MHCGVNTTPLNFRLDITFHAFEYGVTTCPGDGESSLIKWSLTTIVLQSKKIRYRSIAKNKIQCKNKNSIQVQCKK